jgi:hypothetical protein
MSGSFRGKCCQPLPLNFLDWVTFNFLIFLRFERNFVYLSHGDYSYRQEVITPLFFSPAMFPFLWLQRRFNSRQLKLAGSLPVHGYNSPKAEERRGEGGTVHQAPARRDRVVLAGDLWRTRVASPLPHVAQLGESYTRVITRIRRGPSSIEVKSVYQPKNCQHASLLEHLTLTSGFTLWSLTVCLDVFT